MDWHKPDETLEQQVRARERRRSRNWQLGMALGLLLAGAVGIYVLIHGADTQAAERFPARRGFDAVSGSYADMLANPFSGTPQTRADVNVGSYLADDIIPVGESDYRKLETLYGDMEALKEQYREQKAQSAGWDWDGAGLVFQATSDPVLDSIKERYLEAARRVYEQEEKILRLKREGYRQQLRRERLPQMLWCAGAALAALLCCLWWLRRRYRRYLDSPLSVCSARCVERDVEGVRRAHTFYLNFEMDSGRKTGLLRVSRSLFSDVSLGSGVLLAEAGTIFRIYPLPLGKIQTRPMPYMER